MTTHGTDPPPGPATPAARPAPAAGSPGPAGTPAGGAPGDDVAVPVGAADDAIPVGRDEVATPGPGPDDEPVEPDMAGSGDVLPEDLDITRYVGPYTFPNIRRRRIAGTLVGMVALGCLAGWGWTGNGGMLAGGLVLAVVAAWHWLTAWDVRFDETDALVVAAEAVGFPVGHASAQLAWRGFLSRPTWRILCYSADDPPSRRGQVALDAVDGQVIGLVSEANPEDWSQFA